MIEWFKLARRRDILMRGVKVGVVVDTLLTAINYGDVLLTAKVLPLMYWKILSTYASVEAARAT